MRNGLIALAGALVLGGCSTFGIRTEEQPPYAVIEELGGGIEIRAYGPRVAAETIVSGAHERAAQGEAFRILAGYIFGRNRPRERVAMTTPVEVANAPARIAMTAPVETATAPGGLAMRFFMPAGYSRATLPQPTDRRVRILDVPGETLAVLRFTGRGTRNAVAARQADLTQALGGTPWRPAGPPRALFYDPPWTIPFLRRNEVATPVAWKA